MSSDIMGLVPTLILVGFVVFLGFKYSNIGTINFTQPVTGAVRSAPVGFSWTTLFFAFFPALLRGHWIWALIIFIIIPMTFGLALFVFPFIYNKAYIKHLIGEGFKVTSVSPTAEIIEAKLKLKLPMAEQFNPS